MTDKMRAAIYTRIASKSYIIEIQEARVSRFAEEQGYEVSAVYSDNGASGLTFEREAFMRMNADINAGKIDIILIQSISKIGRNIFDVSRWLDDVRKKGVTVKAVDDSVDGDADVILFGALLENLLSKRNGGKVHGA